MAPTLLGEHRELTCDDCGFPLACDSTRQPISPCAVCPNCGFPRNDLAVREDLAGQRILLDHTAFQFRLPRRWEIVAFRWPREAGQIAVKRIVGLPGESVTIRHGDVWISGQIARKNLEQQKALLIPVYDARFPPQTRLPPRWSGQTPGSRWSSQRDRFTHPETAADSRSPSIDWLVYRHWRRKGGADAVQVGPVDDVLPYNQNLPYREEYVHPVADLLLAFRVVEVAGRGMFWIRAGDGRDIILVGIDPEHKKLRVSQNDQEYAVSEMPKTSFAGTEIELSLIDRQFLLALGGQIACRRPLAARDDPPPGTPEPFALGAENLGVTLDCLRIFRDLYYTDPPGNPHIEGDRSFPVLMENEFFVLGDNSALSEDSRHWSAGQPVQEAFLVGKLLMAIEPLKPIAWGGFRLEIPDLTRMRWLR